MDIATLFASLQTTLEASIGDAAPIALTVGGSLLAIGVGWRLVKRFVK
ncbi:hypothetical protein [Demequina sp. NBRC 110054]|nr:hypothetical protein [Demequina sp. NBRC 110054]